MPGETGAGPSAAGARSPGRRLESWKEIAFYLNRHVTTVRRWEHAESLPVHRHRHAKLGSIYAYSEELDRWMASRRTEPEFAIAPPDLALAPKLLEHLAPPPQLTSLAHTTSFVGREDELVQLRKVWQEARDGLRQLVFVSGEPGLGKTRLVFEFARTVARECTVLVGRCDRESLVPFAPLATIVRWLARATPPHALRSRLAEIQASAELAHLAPELQERLGGGNVVQRATAEGHRFRMFDACAELLAATARAGPVLVVIEDAHWADEGTLVFLRHLVRSTRGAGICFVITLRDQDPDRSAGSLEILDGLRREQSATTLALRPLPAQEVSRLVDLQSGGRGAPWVTSFAERHAEGNPLFVTELLRHLAESGFLTNGHHLPQRPSMADVGLPRSIGEVIGRRMGRLAPASRHFLTMAAIVGREFRLPVLECAMNLPEESLLDAMDEALAARLVSEEPGAPGSFSFTHPLIRETLYAGMSAARRVRLHHRVATALEQPAMASTLGELAHHFSQAASYRDAEKAVEYGRLAGDEAARGLALEDAAHYYEMAMRALDLRPGSPNTVEARVDLLVKRGRCFFQLGRWSHARSAFESAVALLPPVHEERRAELLVSLAETAFWLMDTAAVRAHSSEAVELAERLQRLDLWADAQAWLASAVVADGDVLGGVERDRQVIARAGGISSFGLARAPLTLYWAGRSGEAADHARQAVDAARGTGDPAFLLYALQHLGLSLTGAGQYDEALMAFDEARAFGRRCGSYPLLARATSMSVAPLLNLCDFQAAEARATEARELAHRVAFEPPLVSAGLDLLLIYARSGTPERAAALLDDIVLAVSRAGGWHGWKWNMRLTQACAELALARGDCRQALDLAGQVVELSRARHRVKYEALALAVQARASGRLACRDAVALGRSAVEVARSLGDPAVQLECLLTLFEIEDEEATRRAVRAVTARILSSVSDQRLHDAVVQAVSGRTGMPDPA